jgi:hypothetical protein
MLNHPVTGLLPVHAQHELEAMPICTHRAGYFFSCSMAQRGELASRPRRGVEAMPSAPPHRAAHVGWSLTECSICPRRGPRLGDQPLGQQVPRVGAGPVRLTVQPQVGHGPVEQRRDGHEQRLFQDGLLEHHDRLDRLEGVVDVGQLQDVGAQQALVDLQGLDLAHRHVAALNGGRAVVAQITDAAHHAHGLIRLEHPPGSACVRGQRLIRRV